ncbi:hypothetical protein LCGC14_2731140, partial [marine sediment metagenome]
MDEIIDRANLAAYYAGDDGRAEVMITITDAQRNSLQITKKGIVLVRLFYGDETVDTDYIYDIILLVEQEIEKGHHIIINVVSKSGRTTET